MRPKHRHSGRRRHVGAPAEGRLRGADGLGRREIRARGDEVGGEKAVATHGLDAGPHFPPEGLLRGGGEGVPFPDGTIRRRALARQLSSGVRRLASDRLPLAADADVVVFTVTLNAEKIAPRIKNGSNVALAQRKKRSPMKSATFFSARE